MSRSNKNFADFFPTAPSVLQQKRSKPFQLSRDSASLGGRDHHAANAPLAQSASSLDNAKQAHLPNSTKAGSRHASLREDHDGAQADTVHEVGSASSTSTGTESVFSAQQKTSMATQPNGAQKSTSLTPLTNVDSSPRPNGVHSPPKRAPADNLYAAGFSPVSPFTESVTKESWDTSSNLGRTPQHDRPQARPGRGEVKGYKIIYDPIFDKDRKKRSREPEFEAFGQEVCQTIRDSQARSDTNFF